MILECSHKVLSGDVGGLAVLEVFAVVVESHEHTGGRPRELVTKSVVGSLETIRKDVITHQVGCQHTAGSVKPPQ